MFRERGVNLFWTIRACKGKRVLTASQKSAESVSCPQKQHISASYLRAVSGQIDPALEGLTSFINNSLRLTEATRRICGMADLVCPSRLTRIQPQLLSVTEKLKMGSDFHCWLSLQDKGTICWTHDSVSHSPFILFSQAIGLVFHNVMKGVLWNDLMIIIIFFEMIALISLFIQFLLLIVDILMDYELKVNGR